MSLDIPAAMYGMGRHQVDKLNPVLGGLAFFQNGSRTNPRLMCWTEERGGCSSVKARWGKSKKLTTGKLILVVTANALYSGKTPPSRASFNVLLELRWVSRGGGEFSGPHSCGKSSDEVGGCTILCSLEPGGGSVMVVHILCSIVAVGVYPKTDGTDVVVSPADESC